MLRREKGERRKELERHESCLLIFLIKKKSGEKNSTSSFFSLMCTFSFPRETLPVSFHSLKKSFSNIYKLKIVRFLLTSRDENVEAGGVDRGRSERHGAQHPRAHRVVPAGALRECAEHGRTGDTACHRYGSEQGVAERGILGSRRIYQGRGQRHCHAIACKTHRACDKGRQSTCPGTAAVCALFKVV